MLYQHLGIIGMWATLVAATATAQTTSRFSGSQLRPPAATVSVKESVRLTVQVCEFEEAPGDVQPLGYNCRDYPDDVTPILEQASVNGIVGGNAALGRVNVNGSYVHYIAPDKVPARNPVTVSVAMTGKSATGRPNKTVLLAVVRVVADERRPPADTLPARYSGSGKISFSTGTGAGLLKYNATFQVAGERAAGGGVGEYTLPGSVSVSDGEMGLSNCQCLITGGQSTGEAGLGVDAAGKEQSLSVSAYVTVGLSCTPSGGRRTCPSSSIVALTWSNRSRPDCPGSTTTTFTDAQTLTGGYQRTCGNTQETATWTLTGEYSR